MSPLHKLPTASTGLLERARAGGLHLLVSCAIVVSAALLVFVAWYPGDFRYMSGGTDLLLLIMAVDVVMGPLLTFAVFNKAKGSRQLRRDIFTIAMLQLLALAYGIYTVSSARPVALVFEFDRFRVISRADVVVKELPEALPEYRSLPLLGPITVALRRSELGEERSNALATAIFEGVDTSQRPKFWIPYGPVEGAQAFAAGRSVDLLKNHYPSAVPSIEQLLVSGGASVAPARFLPVNARNDAVAIISVDGKILGFLPYDGYI